MHCDENMVMWPAANIGHPYICCGGIAEPSDFGLKTSTIFSIFFARQL